MVADADSVERRTQSKPRLKLLSKNDFQVPVSEGGKGAVQRQGQAWDVPVYGQSACEKCSVGEQNVHVTAELPHPFLGSHRLSDLFCRDCAYLS